MRVLFLTHNETIAPRLFLEIKTLQEQGHQVRVVAWNTSGKEYRFNFPVTYIHSHRRPHSHQDRQKGEKLPHPGRFIGSLYPQMFKEVLRSSWDVVHCCHLALLPVAILAKMAKGGKVIFDSYEFHRLSILLKLRSQRLPTFLRPLLNKIEALDVLGKMEALLLHWVDGVLTFPSVGDQERRRFAKHCPNVEVLMNVPSINGITVKNTFPAPPTAIFTGHLSQAKGLDAMLEATPLVAAVKPDFKLVLIGPLFGDDARVEQKIDRLGIRDNVIKHSWVSPDALGKFLSAAWVGLWLNQPTPLFSLATTGTSRKGFTYWKHGLPVVATSFGEVAKVIAEEKAGILVDATKPEEIAEALLAIIENPELRQEMAANGLAAVRTKYNWEKESGKLINLYKELG